MYKYEDFKSKVFTEEGQIMFLKVRDFVQKHMELSGAVSMGKVLNHVSGDCWEVMACVDRLVELGEIYELTSKNCMGQYRIFTNA